MHASGSGATRHLSGPDLLLVSSAFSQGVCFSFYFFRMPCPFKILLVCALCSLFKSTRESPFSSSLLLSAVQSYPNCLLYLSTALFLCKQKLCVEQMLGMVLGSNYCTFTTLHLLSKLGAGIFLLLGDTI